MKKSTNARRPCAAVTEATRDPKVRAARDGQLTPLPPAALAHIATATLNNIALRARTGAPAAAIDALIDATIDAICGPAA